LFDLVDCDYPSGQQAKHNGDAARDAAIAVLPTSNASRGDIEQPSGAVLRDAKRIERRAKLVRSRGGLLLLPEIFSKAGRCLLPSRVAQLDEGRHRSAPDLLSRSGCIWPTGAIGLK
jgi:hypothetical protein